MSNGEMEKDEAIELLCAYGVPLDEKKFQEALNMAIEALSAEYKHEAFGWCDGCKEYDTENHCCHRYSSFIRETLQDNIDAVLEDIKEEIKELNNQSMFFGYVSNPDLLNAVVEIIEKHISRKE